MARQQSTDHDSLLSALNLPRDNTSPDRLPISDGEKTGADRLPVDGGRLASVLPVRPERRISHRPMRLGRQTRIFRDWGIPEWFVVSQALLATMLFVPGLSTFRYYLKLASFVTSLIAIWLVYRDGRIAKVRRGYQPVAWLKAMIIMLVIMIFHPGTLSLMAGTAQTTLYLSCYAIAFWGVASLRYGFQLQRVFILLFLINSGSALLGIAQFYKPNIFMPQAIPSMMGGLSSLILQYELDDGTKVIRPCGLSDTPGQASYSGAMAATMGLILLTSSLPKWQRMAGLVLAVPGAAVIYLTQVRTSILMVIMSLMALVFAMFLQQRWKSIFQIAISGLVVVLGGFAWAASEGGTAVKERFFTLIADNPANVLMSSSRAQMVNSSLTDLVWDLPLGGGLGRYGQVYVYFGNGNLNDLLWCETQISAWIIDGGLPMLVMGVSVVLIALADTLRVARKCPHPVIRHWAAGIFAINFSLFFICFGQMPFLTNTGQQFWLLAAMTHAADRWVRHQIKFGFIEPLTS